MIHCYSLLIIILTLLSSSIVYAKNIFNQNGNRLEIYGSVNPNRTFYNIVLPIQITAHNDNSMAIIGLSGETQLTNTLSSYIHIEYNSYFFSSENNEDKKKNNDLNLAYAGIKHNRFGSIDYGCNYGIMHDLKAFTNRAPYIVQNSIFDDIDKYIGNRNNSLITYRKDNIFDVIDGISVTLQYQNKNKNRILERQNGPGWGASLQYKNHAGLTVSGTFFSSDKSFLVSNKNLKLESVELYGLGLKYDIKNLYLGAFYGTAKNMTPYKHLKNDLLNQYIDNIQNIELIAEYNVNSVFYYAVSYLNSKGKNINSLEKQFKGINLQLAQQINLSARYKIHKNFSTYLNYKINLLRNNDFIKNNNIKTDNTIGAGIVYQF